MKQNNKDQNVCIRIDRNELQINRCKERIDGLSFSLSNTAQILALAGNEVRLKILMLLREEQGLCVCDLAEILEMKIPAISQHLRKMKDAKLVFTEREGTTIFYFINKKHQFLLDSIFNKVSKLELI